MSLVPFVESEQASEEVKQIWLCPGAACALSETAPGRLMVQNPTSFGH